MLTGSTSRIHWTLTEFGEGAHQHRCHSLPLRELIVGRTDDADLSIPCGSVSKRHARITFERNEMAVEDLGSTNGTYLNGKRIEYSTVKAGDLLQFANALYQVGRARASDSGGTVAEGILPWAHTLLLFDQLLSDRAVIPHFQPIVALEDQATVGLNCWHAVMWKV